MKKTVVLTFSLLILAVGCQLEKREPLQRDDYPQFIASTEVFTPTSKTLMTPERLVVWSAGDKVAVFQGSAFADEYMIDPSSVGKTEAALNIVKENDFKDKDYSIETNVAYYPYSSGLSLLESVYDDDLSYQIVGVDIPLDQEYTVKSFANGSFPMVAVTDVLEDHNLKFRNVLGAVKFQLTGNQKLMSIELKGNNDERLSGSATVTVVSDNSAPTIEMSSDSRNSVILHCGNGVQLNTDEPTEFILAVPPTEFANGFTVYFTDSKNNVTSITTESTNIVYRSSILVMPCVDVPEISIGSTEDVNKGEDVGIKK